MAEFTPENDLERALVAACSDPSKRPEFFRLLLESEVFVIMDGREPGVTGRVRLEVGEKLKLRGVEIDGAPMVLFFSSLTRLHQMAGGPAPYISGPTSLFLPYIEGTAIFLNLGTQFGLTIGGSQVRDLLEGRVPFTPTEVRMKAGEDFHVGPPPSVPAHIVDALCGFLKTRKEVRAAHLAQYLEPPDGSPPHPIIGLDVSGDVAGLVQEVGMVLQGAAGDGEMIDFLLLGSSAVSKAIVSQGKLVYRRKWFGFF